HSAFGALRDLGAYVVDGFKSLDWGAIWSAVSGVGEKIVSSLRSVDWSGISATIGAGLRGAFDTLADIGRAVVDRLKTVDWRGVGDYILGAIGAGFGALSDIGSKLYDALASYDWSNLADRITSGLADIGGAIGGYVKDKLAAVDWSSVGETILGAIGRVFQAAKDVGNYLADAIEKFDWTPVGQKVAEYIKKGLQAAWDLLGWMKDKISGVTVADASDTFSGWFGAVVGAFSEFWRGFSDEMTGGAGWKAAFIDLFWSAFNRVVSILSTWGGNIKNDLAGHLVGLLVKVDKFSIDFANFWIYAVNGALRQAYNLRDWIGGIFEEAVGKVETALNKLGITKAFDDLKTKAEGPLNTVVSLLDTVKNSVQWVIDAFNNLRNVDLSGWNPLSGGGGTAAVGGAEALKYFDIFKNGTWLEGAYLTQEQAERRAAGGFTVQPGIPPQLAAQTAAPMRTGASTGTGDYFGDASQGTVSTGKAGGVKQTVITTGSGTSTVQSRADLVGYSNLGNILETTPGAGWGGYLNTGAAVPGAVTQAVISNWMARMGGMFGTGAPVGGGLADYSALFGEAPGSMIDPEGRSYLSPYLFDETQSKAKLSAWFGYDPNRGMVEGETPAWAAQMDTTIQAEIGPLRDATNQGNAILGQIATAGVGTETNTAAIGLGIASTGNLFQNMTSELGAKMEGMAGWLSRAATAQEAAAAAGPQPGQIISKADVAGFANAVTYAISPETGKLTAYIGSAGKELEKLAVNGGQEILNAATVSGSTTISSAQRAAVIQEQSYQQAGIAQLSSVYASGSVFQNAATLSGQRITSAAEVAAVTQTNAANTGAVTQTNAANLFGQTVTGGGNSFLGSVDQSRAGWLSDVVASGGSFGAYTDVAGSSFGIYAETAGGNFDGYVTDAGKKFSEAILAVFARILGGGGGSSGASSASSAGYSMLSSAQSTLSAARALGLQTEYLVQTCLGTTVAVNALIYTNPAGYSYSINPLNYHSTGGVSSYMSATTGVQGLYSSGGVTPVKLGKYAEGGVAIGPQLAIVGDNPSRKEAIIPEEVWGSGKSARQVVEVYLDGRKITAGVASRMQREIPSVANMRTH
ncbi:MAG: hypothetical protein WBK88_03365, partial [Methanothrix sp.]